MNPPVFRFLPVALSWLATCASAAAPATVAMPTVESVARETLVEALAPALAARGATMTITVAAPDPRRVLAPCGQLAGFLAPGARLVGKTVVGVRCLDGGPTTAWQTFVAADVHVDAPVWQATRALRAGEPLAADDAIVATAPLTPADIDVAAGGGRAGASRGLASIDGRLPAPIGRTVQRPVGAGRPLSAADIRDEGRVNAGESVRVIYVGDGFSVASAGRTIGAADPGSNVQIRLDSGAVVNGTLRADRQVEMSRGR